MQKNIRRNIGPQKTSKMPTILFTLSKRIAQYIVSCLIVLLWYRCYEKNSKKTRKIPMQVRTLPGEEQPSDDFGSRSQLRHRVFRALVPSFPGAVKVFAFLLAVVSGILAVVFVGRILKATE